MVEWNETFDVVVVGFGFTGAAAAVAAHDAGARVLLLEKMAHPGGISICSAGGVRIADDAAAAFRYLKETNADTAPDDCLRALARGMTEVEGFIRQLASVNGAEVAVARVAANYPFEGGDTFGFVTIKSIPGYDPEAGFTWGKGLRGGTRLFKVMADNVAARAIDVRLETPARRLIAEDGRVRGVALRGANEARRIRARGGVVLACGGFEADPEMQRQYWQEKPVLPAAFAGNTGDGIRMAQAVGADLWHMWHYHGTYGLRHPDAEVYPYGIRLHRLPDWVPEGDGRKAEAHAFFAGDADRTMPWIVVDQTARRYMNEYPPYVQDTGHRMMEPFDPVTQRYLRIPSWLIVDAAGCARGPLGSPTYNDPARRLRWSDDNAAEIATGILERADTVAEMAAAMNAEEGVLADTLARWNGFCRDGMDQDFGRNADTMMPIETPPFTFGRVWPVCANTQGGPRHDSRQRVLGPFSDVIDGLYVAGELGSVFGHLYIAGGNLAECFIGGRMAGEEAARRSGAAAVQG